jgi:hypothetical protein
LELACRLIQAEIMECWGKGILNMKNGWNPDFILPNNFRLNVADLIPPNPAFQFSGGGYSTFHHSISTRLLQPINLQK